MSTLAALLSIQTMLLTAPAAPGPGDGASEQPGELRLREGWCADPYYSGPWYCLARCTGYNKFYVVQERPIDPSGDWDDIADACYLKAMEFCTSVLSQYLDRSCLGGAS